MHQLHVYSNCKINLETEDLLKSTLFKRISEDTTVPKWKIIAPESFKNTVFIKCSKLKRTRRIIWDEFLYGFPDII